ncbi:hypothetical protein EMCRGX_G017902 [Ephydatia muelleri]
MVFQVGRLENAIGWYHSHPGYGCWLSGIDVSTQMMNQTYQEPWVAIVVDPIRTMSSGKVNLGAFRTYPKGYTPTSDGPSEYQTIPLEKIEDFGVHCKRYYSLEVSYFKSSLDSHLLDLLWNKYWVSTLSTCSILTNADYTTQQMADLTQKLERVDSQSSSSMYRFSKASETGVGLGGGGGGGKGEGRLTKAVQDCSKTTIEVLHGLMGQVLKDRLFNSQAP